MKCASDTSELFKRGTRHPKETSCRLHSPSAARADDHERYGGNDPDSERITWTRDAQASQDTKRGTIQPISVYLIFYKFYSWPILKRFSHSRASLVHNVYQSVRSRVARPRSFPGRGHIRSYDAAGIRRIPIHAHNLYIPSIS